MNNDNVAVERMEETDRDLGKKCHSL